MASHLLVLLLSATATTSALSQEASLDVSLIGVQHDGGSLRVGLYSDPGSFRKEARAVAIRQVPAQSGTVRVRFAGLQPGRYAIMAYHDEDGNGELNRRFGMFPTEGYGLSNNPSISGPPAFDDSAFEVPQGGAETALRIELRY